MTLHALIGLIVNLSQFAIPAALFAWADRAWEPADTGPAPTTPRSSRT